MNFALLTTTLAALLVCACSDDSRQGTSVRKVSEYRMLHDPELRNTLIGKNIRDVNTGAYFGNDGIDIFPDGYAVVLVEGSIRASYTIEGSQFCLKTFNAPQCSYFITDGSRVFRVPVRNRRAVSLIDICPISYPGEPRIGCRDR